MSESVTIKDIAKKAGVSIGTVSGILNNQARFSDATKARVWSIANELSYKPNQDARKLRAGTYGDRPRSNIIMYISNTESEIPQDDPYERMCLSLFSREAQNHGLFLTKYWYDGRQGFSCPPLLNGLVDGVILGTPYKETIEILQDKAVPMVLTDSPFHADLSHAPTVNLNVRKGVYDIFRRLKELGHKNIGICHSSSTFDAPFYGIIMEAAMANEIAVSNEFLQPLKNLSTQTHEEIMSDFADFAEAFIKNKKISALFCTNDFYALSLYRILTAKGIAIPEEFSLIGCGRADLKLFESPVATVAYDWHELTKVAVRLLKDMIDGRELRPQIEITVNPIVYYGQTIGKAGI